MSGSWWWHSWPLSLSLCTHPHVLFLSGLHVFSYMLCLENVSQATSVHTMSQWHPVIALRYDRCPCWWYRDHILNIKDAPAPKPAGKGAKRTLEQATAVPPVTAAASAQPAEDVSAAAPTTAEAPAAEVDGQASDGQNTTTEQPAAQEQTASDADPPQLPGLAPETAQAGSSEPQADGAPIGMVSVACQDMCMQFKSCGCTLVACAELWLHFTAFCKLTMHRALQAVLSRV